MPDPWTHALPANTRARGTGDPANDEDANVDALIALGVPYSVLNPVYGNADPTGATDSQPALQAALNAAPAGMPVMLPPAGVFRVDSPLTVPPGTGFQAYGRGIGSPYDWAGVPVVGSKIQASAAFSGTAIIQMINNTANELGGQVFRNIVVDGHLATGGVHGIWAQGCVFAVTIEDCMVYSCPGTGVMNVTGTGGGAGPDDWYVSGLKVSHCAVGVSTIAPDSWWIGCEASECTGNNWNIVAGGNARYVSCKGENSIGGYGWHIQTGNTGAQFFQGCTSQINFLSGFFVTGVANAQGNGVVSLANCASNADASVQGTASAGLTVSACAARVLAPGFISLLTVGGAYPPYGAQLINSSNQLVLTGAFLQGHLGAAHDDGSNTVPLVNNLPVT